MAEIIGIASLALLLGYLAGRYVGRTQGFTAALFMQLADPDEEAAEASALDEFVDAQRAASRAGRQ